MKNYELQSFVNILLISPAWSMGSWLFPDEIPNATKYKTTPKDTAIPLDIGVRSNFRRGRCSSNQQCVELFKCKNECTRVQQGLLQTDKQVGEST